MSSINPTTALAISFNRAAALTSGISVAATANAVEAVHWVTTAPSVQSRLTQSSVESAVLWLQIQSAGPAKSGQNLLISGKLFEDAATSAAPNDAKLQGPGTPLTGVHTLAMPPSLAQSLRLQAGDWLRLHLDAPTEHAAQPDNARSAATPALQLSDLGRRLAAVTAEPTPAGQEAWPLRLALPASGAWSGATLQQAVEQSGLFYESHLRQWVSGERDLAAVRAEPQNRHRMTDPDPTDTATPTAHPATPDDLSTLSQAQALKQQLQVLERQQVTLALEAWPGQTAQLTLSSAALHGPPDDPAHRDSYDQGGSPQQHAYRDSEHAAAPQVSYARLALTVPSLGRVEIALRLREQHVDLRLSHADPTTFQAAADELLNALQAQGLTAQLLCHTAPTKPE